MLAPVGWLPFHRLAVGDVVWTGGVQGDGDGEEDWEEDSEECLRLNPKEEVGAMVFSVPSPCSVYDKGTG